MNKKIIILSLFLISAVFAFAANPSAKNEQEKLLTYTPSKDNIERENMWGFLWDYRFDYNKHYGLSVALKIGKVLFYITEDGIREKPTNISDKKLSDGNDLENELSKSKDELNKSKRENDLSDMITEAFQVWFDDTKAAIEKAGRQDEFKDIMPILDRRLEPLSKASAIAKAKKYKIPVVRFHFTTENEMHEICGETTACQGKTSYGSKIIAVHPYTRAKSAFFTKHQIYIQLIHEIGHYYGLADQYRNGAWNADEEYSTGKDRVKDGTSVMASNHSAHLTCDDIDGFINLIDFTLSKQKQNELLNTEKKGWSDRAKRGWASFCNGKEGYKDTFYKMAKPI